MIPTEPSSTTSTVKVRSKSIDLEPTTCTCFDSDIGADGEKSVRVGFTKYLRPTPSPISLQKVAITSNTYTCK